MELVLIACYAALFFLSIFLFQVGFCTKTHHDHRPPPGPLALPIIGHLHLLGSNMHRSFDDLSRRYGPLFQLRLGSIKCVVASTPELAKEFLKTHELIFASRNQSPAIKLITYDLSLAFSPYGPYSKVIKKLFTNELLSSRNMKHYQPIRTLEIHRFLHGLMEKAQARETMNVTEEILKLTNNIICQMMLSIRCSETESDAEKARSIVLEVTEIFGKFDVSDIIWFCKNFDLQGIQKRANNAHERYDALLEKIISDRERERSVRNLQRQHDKGSSETNDILDMLLDAKENNTAEVKLTRNHIKALIFLSSFHVLCLFLHSKFLL